MPRLTSIILFFLFSCFANQMQASLSDSITVDSSKSKPYTLIALPAVFFTPETNWGFGALGILSFRFKGEQPESRPSQVQLGLAYTLNKQYLVFLPFEFYLKDERYKYYGELGYYLYTYEFYGIGNDKSNELREVYEVLYPRLRLNALYQFKPNFYAGLRYWMDDFKIQELDSEGALIDQTIAGSQGSFLSGAGFIFNFDNRNNIFYPDKGSFAELVLFHNGASLGSDFDYSKVILNASTFLKLKDRHILGFNWYSEFTLGTAPFNQLALLGGPKRMRGNFEGRYRDKHMILFQSEYRFPLFWRFGGVAFGGLGRVAGDFNEFGFDDVQYSIGLGGRFLIDPKEKLHLRVDYGFGRNGSGFYFTFGEAF